MTNKRSLNAVNLQILECKNLFHKSVKINASDNLSHVTEELEFAVNTEEPR